MNYTYGNVGILGYAWTMEDGHNATVACQQQPSGVHDT